MMTVPSAIMYESVLSAINLGVKPPTASLGSLITDTLKRNLQYYPYQVMIPAGRFSTDFACVYLIG